MKVRLLNDGGYTVHGWATFPVIVNAEYDECSDTCDVDADELQRVGFSYAQSSGLCFSSDEYELVNDTLPSSMTEQEYTMRRDILGDRVRELEAEMADLEAEIRKLIQTYHATREVTS